MNTVVAALVVLTVTATAACDRSPATDAGPDPRRAPDQPITGPQGAVGQFVVQCAATHRNRDDPIVHAAHHGASHLHQYFGSRATAADSTYEELVAAPTSCENPADTAAYWMPAMLVGGRPIKPVRAIAYYRAGPDVDPSTVQSYPPSLMMVAGDAGATAPQPTSVVAWSCGGGRREASPPRCPSGTELRFLLTFPDCWDGQRLDSDDHRSHVAYSSGGVCADTHPVPIPQLQLAVDFPPVDPSSAALSSGPLHTAHGDFWNTWDQDALDREVRHCLRRDLVCGVAD